ncbi:MAG: 50S ribosomal protein L29 [Bacteroidales bacterium]
MKIAEIRELSSKELVEKIAAIEVELNQMLLNHSITPLENPAVIKEQRRTIARIRTVLRQRDNQ